MMRDRCKPERSSRCRIELALILAAVCCACQCGCISSAKNAVPAYRLAELQRTFDANDKLPIDLALLGQNTPQEHLIGPGDLLGVYVYGVLPPDIDQAPIVQSATTLNLTYYPSGGSVNLPTLGVPIEVDDNGLLNLPLVGGVDVRGLTAGQARQKVIEAYEAADVVQQGRDRTTITLLKRRVHRVVVLREDAGSELPQNIIKEAVPYTKRGRAQVVDLPTYENDVLHALAATGGLPGIDTENEVWVFRKRGPSPGSLESADVERYGTQDFDSTLDLLKAERRLIRIPLNSSPVQPCLFEPSDVILHDGDVVFIPKREDFFFTGGLLHAGQIPLPRDRDIDVLEAIAMAGGSIGGPGGASAAVFRAGAGPGFIIPPTRAMVLRKLSAGRQLLIRVDLARALKDPKERILIQRDDVVMLYYKPHEMTANVALNLFNFSYVLSGNSN